MIKEKAACTSSATIGELRLSSIPLCPMNKSELAVSLDSGMVIKGWLHTFLVNWSFPNTDCDLMVNYLKKNTKS